MDTSIFLDLLRADYVVEKNTRDCLQDMHLYGPHTKLISRVNLGFSNINTYVCNGVLYFRETNFTVEKDEMFIIDLNLEEGTFTIRRRWEEY